MAMKRYSGGRPSMFTPEGRLMIKRSLLAGNSYDAASRAAGVQSRALYRWFRLYPDFRKKCERWRRTGRLRPTRAYGGNGAGTSLGGTLSPHSEVVCTEEERMAAVRCRELRLAGQSRRLTAHDRKLLDTLIRRVAGRISPERLREMKKRVAERRKEAATEEDRKQQQQLGPPASPHPLRMRA
jgi:hypothetical protein